MSISSPLTRIGIAGIASESSTFSPHRTTLADFTVLRGQDVLRRYPFLLPPDSWASEAEWVPTLHARALPGGAVTATTYEQLKTELVHLLTEAGPLDGAFLDLHGALSVPGYQDVEADLVGAIREVVGKQVLLSASMDLHGNMSRRLATMLDLATCYRTAPHEDEDETRERAARKLVDRIRHGLGRPHKAWIPVPVLLPGEKTSTRVEPARSLYAQVVEAASEPGILDAALWVGYAWADEPRCHAAVVVTGDSRDKVGAAAVRLAHGYWDARADFDFGAPAASLSECIRRALASDHRPFLISDSGDNPTAGGAGDVSYALDQLVAAPELANGAATAIYASLVDPDAVTRMQTAGAGAAVRLSLGGHIDGGPAAPVNVAGTVAALVEADPVGGAIGVLEVGGLRIVTTSRRKAFHRIIDFTTLSLDPRRTDLVVVKIGYLEPELYEIAADWLLALTPGGVDQDLPRLGYRNIRRPIYPLDPDMPDPDLAAEFL